MSIENDYYILLVILLDSVVDVEKKSCPLIFLEECKYVVRKKKVTNTINEELHLDEFNDESDNDKFNEYDED